MVKTLRITGIIVAILAAVFVVFSAVFGVGSDKESKKFLNSAGAIENFNKAKGDKAAKGENQISPLVKQAEAFALYLNPPKPKKPIVPREPSSPRRPPTVTPKFTLIGTSYYALHPELSIALIDEPGKGLRWVRQSSEIGHLIIEQVKDGVVIIRDGKRTFELAAERPKKRSLLKDSSSSKSGSKFTSPVLGKAGAGITPLPLARGKKEGRAAQMSAEQKALAEKIFTELKAMQANVESDKIDSEHRAEPNAAPMEKSISDLETMRISDEEAKRLGTLGKELKDVREDPNQAKKRRIKRPRSSRDPNRPARK